MKIICIKMNNGDELVAEKEPCDGLVIKKVRQLVMGQHGAGLIPWMMTNPDGKFFINETSYATCCEATIDVSTAYIESTTGIAMAPQSKLITH